MKKRGKILCLIMFLFIYFLAPKNVFAVQGAVVCVCTGSVNLELNLIRDDNNGDSFEVKWADAYGNKAPAGYPESFTGSISNGGKFTLNSSTPGSSDMNCPAAVVAESISQAGGSYKGKMFFYDNAHSGEATTWANDINKTKKENGGKGLFSAFDSPAQAALLKCSKKTTTRTNANGEVVSSDNSVVSNNTTTNILNEQIQDDVEKDQTAKKEKWDRHQRVISSSEEQTCATVLGNANDPAHEDVAWLLQKILNYIRIFGILLVLVFSALEFSKVILSNDYEALKKAQHKTIYRVGGIVALLLLPMLVNFLLGLFISGSFDFSCGIR